MPGDRAPARDHNAPGENHHHHAEGVLSLIERPARRKSVRAHLLGDIIGAALEAGSDLDEWAATGGAASAFLTIGERALLVWAVARTLSAGAAARIIEAAFPAAGPPVPPFSDPRADAAEWAANALPAELQAYVTAAFRALDPADRRRFAVWAARRQND